MRYMLKKILSAVTLVLVAIIIYAAREQVWEALLYLQELNAWVLLLLIPQQLAMYAAAGQMYFSFLRAKMGVKLGAWKATRVSLEINFVNHVVPSGGVAGVGYLAWRLKEYNISAGQATFVHVLRYAIAALVNVGQMLIAIAIMALTWASLENELTQQWVLWFSLLACTGIVAVIVGAFWLIMNKKRIDWFSRITAKTLNGFVRKITRGKRRKILDEAKIDKYFTDLHDDWKMVRRNKKLLRGPLVWAIVYNAFEAMTYFIVACAFGHPEILPQLLLAEGLAGFVGAVVPTPGGVGGYEGAMIGIMIATGVDFHVATVVVVVTRVTVLIMTIVSGWGFYQAALMGRKDKFKPEAAAAEK